jgi:gamma-glutamyltranspeptidase/glutathione hydrolase
LTSRLKRLLPQVHFIVVLSLLFPIVLSLSYAPISADEAHPAFDPEARFNPVYAREGMVVSESEYATRAGIEVLREGGNAVDAAVTVGFTMAVTYPRAGNLGGGGFMLIYLTGAKEAAAVDYREKAPLAARREMYLDEKGNVDEEKSRHGIIASGVPGTVAGLALALEKYGTISLERALRPAIELAENGFPADEDLVMSLSQAKDRMKTSPESMKVFFKNGGASYAPGELLIQNDLARSLRKISEDGPDAFYKGEIAEKITGFMKSEGGLITKKDLASYEAIVRKPVRGSYRGYEVYSMPPPSSGGVLLIEMLNMLERFPLGGYGHNSARAIHLMAECMKLAYADRSVYLGDPDFADVPVSRLISKEYAKRLSAGIDPERATPSDRISPGSNTPREGGNTTHFSVTDKWGNAVSNTYTLNFNYGSSIMVPGTGILLNNEMDDFSIAPGVPNAYGLTGGEYNALAPGKRMLSSMTPTIVLKDGKPFLITGSVGGSLIITTVLQIMTNVIDFGMNVSEATNAVRVHHQWLPDELRIERGLSPDTVRLLREMGYEVVTGDTMGSAQSIVKIGDFIYGAADPRRPGGFAGGIKP